MHRLWLILLTPGFMLRAADPALLLHLRLNEGEGTQALDSSGRAHHAKLVNAEWVDLGLEGRAVRLTGDASHIELPPHDDFALTQDFTFLLWVKVDRFERHGLSLFVRGNYVKGWQTYVYRSFIAMSSRALGKGLVHRCRFPAGTLASYPFNQIAITGKKLDEGQTAVSFYVNGTLGETFTVEGELPVSSHPLTIGSFASNEGVCFRGIIDEVRVYSRALSAAEVRDNYGQLNEGTPLPRALSASAATPLPAVELPPLRRRCVALFAPPADFPGTPVRETGWFEDALRELGLQVTRLAIADLVSTEVVTRDRFDTLILPTAHMPFEAEDSVFRFMASGGNLVTVSSTPTTWKSVAGGEMESKQHRRGWFAPFLIRHLDFPWAQRRLDQEVELSPEAAALVGRLLPGTAGPYPKRRYSLVDRWDLHPAAAGRPGDTDVTDGRNVCAAADIMLPLYRRANGEATDFHVYRYFNNRLSDVTLVELGSVGSELIATNRGRDVLSAVLHLAEAELPGQQSPAYYADVNRLHRDWSRLGDAYVDTLGALRDAAYAAQLFGSDAWKERNRELAAVETLMSTLVRDKDAWDQSLLNGSDPGTIASATSGLLRRIGEAESECQSLLRSAADTRPLVHGPAKVTVKHPYGKLLVESFLTLPTNLSMLRTWHFPTMKRIGVNAYSGRLHPWYAADPVVRRQMQGIVRDLGFQYGVTSRLKPASGELNPADGTIRDGPPQEYDHAEAEAYIRKALAATHGHPALRIGLAHETGLGLRYWGTQARNDYQQYLARQYRDIDALNGHWGTEHTGFNVIQLPTRMPVTPGEHAAWEHWRNLREAKFEEYLKFFYDTVKAYAPDVAVSGTVSTGSLQSPLYGVNFYNVTRYQDISGIDGTAVNTPREWVYLDLTTKPVLTCEWGGLYQPAPLTYVNGKLWEELTGGCIGFNLWIWQFGNCRCNYVDFSGLPTLYGSRARATVNDARRIEHVIMDGRRALPEIGILFSQTTRAHDQGWGAKGESTASPHVQAVTNYYAHFLRFHRSARVIAEEQLLEHDIGHLRLLVVAQAAFLSEKVQQRLLDYARDGGTLLLEGRAGQFDNFGQRLDLLFRAARVAPAHTDGRDVTIGDTSWPTSEDDPVFAPTPLSGSGRVLARFGTVPAVLGQRLGKGDVIVVGIAGTVASPRWWTPSGTTGSWRLASSCRTMPCSCASGSTARTPTC